MENVGVAHHAPFAYLCSSMLQEVGNIAALRDVSAAHVMTIDVAGVVRERLPRHSRFIPRIVLRGLEKLIHQDDLNGLLRSNAGREGSDFCRGVLEDLDVTYRIAGGENLPAPDDSRVVYVSNHPLGALDGIALIDMVARRHGREPRFVVNDLLMAVKPLCNVFVPINKFGCQSRGSSDALNMAFAGDAPVIVFPAGLVSRRSGRGGIADLQWKKMAVQKAVETRRDIIPLFFGGRNSAFFYNFAKLRTLSGLRLNIEMALLPGEIFKCRHRCFDIAVGRRIGCDELEGGRAASAEIDSLREAVYALAPLTAVDR